MVPMRSLLFAPGNNFRRVEKALSLNADGVIVDLEDAVALTEKKAAREMVRKALEIPRRNRLYVRVNALDTDFIQDDLEEVIRPGLDGVVLPKAESAEGIRYVDWLISQQEKKHGLGSGTLDLIPIIESALGVVRALEIASASKRVSRLAFGAIDFTLDIGTNFSKSGTEVFYARSQLVIASSAARIQPPVDTPYPDIQDIEGLVADTKKVRQLGFFGRLVIHPSQIQPVNEIFTPTADEIEHARRVVEAFNEAEARGIAAIQLDGKFIDYPVAARAKKVLELVETLRDKN
ncbi:HpcH/HpaI aldolase/citrate lyase family protein [Calderihabitans maritimus]|uniref:Citrate lyase beta subunit n=1 Tax=Calderihabitans maritimus TaxID=1246530 RepID=A0A1Z5HTF7_9FIRM|nr:CoA ester lyase [Calderihabitans maritimus]GAW92804.1 citrate lyase beta subunit [Calderihabitans maritimus]